MHAAFLLGLFLASALTYPTDLTQECVEEIRAAYEKHIFISKEEVHDHPAVLKKVMKQINLNKCMNVTLRFKISKPNEAIQITGVHRKPKNEHKVNKEHHQPHHENNQQEDNSEDHQDHTVHSFINNEHNGNTYSKQKQQQYPSNNNVNGYNQNQDKYDTDGNRNENYENSYKNQNRRQGNYNNPRRPNEDDYNFDDEDSNNKSNGNYGSFSSNHEPIQYSDNPNDDEINSNENEDPNGYHQPNENHDNSYTDTNPPMGNRKDYTPDDSQQYSTLDDFQQLSTTLSDFDSQINDGGFTRNKSKKQSIYTTQPINDSSTSKKDDTTTPMIDTYTNSYAFSSTHPYTVTIDNLNQHKESTAASSQDQVKKGVSSGRENESGYTTTPIPDKYTKTETLNPDSYEPYEPYDNMNPSKENNNDSIPNDTETTTSTLTSTSTELNDDHSLPISYSSDKTEPDEKNLKNKQDVTTEKVNIADSSTDEPEKNLAENVTSPKTTQDDIFNSAPDTNNEQPNKTNSQESNNHDMKSSEFDNTYPVDQTEVYSTTKENNNKELGNSNITPNKDKNDMDQYGSYEYASDDKHEYNLYDQPQHTYSFIEQDGINSDDQNWNQKTTPKTSNDDENFNKPSEINKNISDQNTQIKLDLNKTSITDKRQQADTNMEPITHDLDQPPLNQSPQIKKDQNQDENEDINNLEVISLPPKDKYKKHIKSHNQALEVVTKNTEKKPHVSDVDTNANIDKSQPNEDDTNNIKNLDHDQLNINELNNPENNKPQAVKVVYEEHFHVKHFHVQKPLTPNIPTMPRNPTDSDEPNATAISQKKQYKFINYDDVSIPTKGTMSKSTQYYEKLKRQSMERQKLEQKQYLPATTENPETVEKKDTETVAVNVVRTVFCKILVTIRTWITEIIRALSKNNSEECTLNSC